MATNRCNPTFSGSFPDFKEKKIVRVQYPGVVKDANAALKTLGGLEQLEWAVVDKKKLQVNFRPNDKLSKGAVADRDLKPGVLIKVKCRQKKGKLEAASSSNPTDDLKIVDYEILGATSLNFIFNSMTDFQYLPLVKTEDGKSVENISGKLIPKELPNIDFLQQNLPFLCIPSTFSRYNRMPQFPSSYEQCARPELEAQLKHRQNNAENGSSQEVEGLPKQLSLHKRKVRHPPKTLIQSMQSRGVPVDKVVALFEERPIWSSSAVSYKTGMTQMDMKAFLPTIAVYVRTGPWNNMWIKNGYDPKQDQSSRIYQTLDIRVRNAGLQQKVEPKRGETEPIAMKKCTLKEASERDEKKIMSESEYIFKPGVIPPARQKFYQLCDLQLPEIQNMLAKLPASTTYDHKLGWLPPKFLEQCREITRKYITEQIRAEMLIKVESNETKPKKNETCSNLETNATAGESENMDCTETNVVVIDDDPDYSIFPEDDDAGQSDESMSSEAEAQENEEFSDDIEIEIDEEVVEEINKMIGSIHPQE